MTGELDDGHDTQESCDYDAACDDARERELHVRCYVVAIYLCDRAYGGPEEGGWYYDCGARADEHNEHLRGFAADKRAEAVAYARTLNEGVCKVLNEGRPSISSVLSEGCYMAEVWDNRAPDGYPAEKPHYE